MLTTCTGTWYGELVPSEELVSIAGDRYPIVLALEESKGRVTGAAGPSPAALSHGRVTSGTFDVATGRVYIVLDSPEDPDGRVVLDGEVTRDAISGRFLYGTYGRGEFQLRRVT